MAAILIDSRLLEKEYVFESAVGTARMNAALFARTFISVRLKGWEGGKGLFDESFEPQGVKMNALNGAYSISAGEAQSLKKILGEVIEHAKPNQEFMGLIEPLLRMASHGAFVVHT